MIAILIKPLMSVPRYKKWFLKVEPYQNSMHIDAYLVGTRCPLNAGYLL